MDNYIGICLDIIKNEIHKANTLFNVVTNYFDMFSVTLLTISQIKLKEK